MTDKLQWQRTKLAEDELSVLWRERAEPESPEQVSEAARKSQADTFWPFIEALADRCDEVLQEHGFPPAAEMVRHDGAGTWWRHPPDAPTQPRTGEAWKFTRGEALAQEFASDFSNAWYAGRIGWKCRLALEHRRKGDAGKAHLFSLVFEIANLRTDWRWRCGHKPSIVTGRKQRKTLDAQRRAAHAAQREGKDARRKAIAAMLRDTNLTGGALERYLIRRLQEEAGITAKPRTIRRDLRTIRRDLSEILRP